MCQNCETTSPDRDKPSKSQKWDKRFFELSNHIAQWSEDPHFKVGAILVGPDQEIRATGYNGLPRGISLSDPSRLNRETGEKFYWVEHAERNCLYNAARAGISTQGCTIYINRYPCSDCTRAIIQSGISQICCPSKPEFDGALDHSFDVSEQMIAEAGLELKLIGPE